MAEDEQATVSTWDTSNRSAEQVSRTGGLDDWQWSSNTRLPDMVCRQLSTVWPTTSVEDSSQWRDQSSRLQMGLHKNSNGHPIVVPFYVCDVTQPVSDKPGRTRLQRTTQRTTSNYAQDKDFHTTLKQQEGLYFLTANTLPLTDSLWLTVKPTPQGNINDRTGHFHCNRTWLLNNQQQRLSGTCSQKTT